MESCGFFEPYKSAYLVYYLVQECKYSHAAKYLYALRRISMNEWLSTTSELLRLATNSTQLSTYATLIEVSKGSLLDQKAHLVPGLLQDTFGQHFDHKSCLSFVKKTRLIYWF